MDAGPVREGISVTKSRCNTVDNGLIGSQRKKCDNHAYPCGNCRRLKLECDVGTRLVWEDNPRREEMGRRGPTSKASQNRGSASFDGSQYPHRDGHGSKDDGEEAAVISQQSAPVSDSAIGPSHTTIWTPPRSYQISSWQFDLDETELRLLDNYLQRFSRMYPTCSGPENPFLSIFVPLSMRNRVVLDSILALTSVQSWANGVFEMERTMLRLHRKAIQGCMRLVRRVLFTSNMHGGNIVLSELQNSVSGMALPVANTAGAIDDVLALLASCVLLLLYEKLSGGDQVAATPHLQLFVRLIPVRALLSLISGSPDRPNGVITHPFDSNPWAEAFRSTSSHLPTLSMFYLGEGEEAGHETESILYQHTLDNQKLFEHGVMKGRYSLPNMIARLSAGDCLVSDEDIAAWDGRLDWFPSFSLINFESERILDLHERLPTADPNFVLNTAFYSLKSFMSLGQWRDEAIVRELYHIAATVYRKQRALQRFIEGGNEATGCAWTNIDPDMETTIGNLPFWAIELLQLLPPGSAWENCLLRPIGVVAKVLVTHAERSYVIFRLMDLEKRFQIRLYYVVRQQLLSIWSMRDKGIFCAGDQETCSLIALKADEAMGKLVSAIRK
ncbi:hypothetical protein PHISCL_05186 [Aspergillus sclerotialis]|uniref:Uncharacterized protein n=1 Tax=Aspergillus sclerotialis TaxID=2070753 RepID=A0A3A2ZIX6_9EURO|nr:hypothetical protein PHISCL_05186 [Aspergillus sclerotialis]